MPWQASFEIRGENAVTPARPAAPGHVDSDHVVGMPFIGHPADNTFIMSILCNATQFKVQCRMADPDGMRVPRPGFGGFQGSMLCRVGRLLWRRPSLQAPTAHPWPRATSCAGFRSPLAHPNPAWNAAKVSRVKVSGALNSCVTVRPWTCRRPRAILTFR